MGVPDYPLGTSDHERQRLVRQAGYLHPITLDVFRAAGIAPGMRVLDVGCGCGDVAMLAAELVGKNGFVVAIDSDANNLDFAHKSAAEAGHPNIEFRLGEMAAFAGDRPFDAPVDALIGRFILLYLPDPVAALRGLAKSLRPGGIVAFMEPDFTPPRSHPHVESVATAVEWIYAAMRVVGVRMEIALHLYEIFSNAGLSNIQMSSRQWVGGGPGYFMYEYLADTIRSVMPVLEKYGIATASEIQIETLAQRIENETVSKKAALFAYSILSAWATAP